MIDASERSRIAVLGLGYVGLPLAVAFCRALSTMGFDINARRTAELNDGLDRTLRNCAQRPI